MAESGEAAAASESEAAGAQVCESAEEMVLKTTTRKKSSCAAAWCSGSVGAKQLTLPATEEASRVTVKSLLRGPSWEKDATRVP